MVTAETLTDEDQVRRIVRLVCPIGKLTAVTYSAITGAVRGALAMTSVQADGSIIDDDVIEIVNNAAAAINARKGK